MLAFKSCVCGEHVSFLSFRFLVAFFWSLDESCDFFSPVSYFTCFVVRQAPRAKVASPPHESSGAASSSQVGGVGSACFVVVVVMLGAGGTQVWPCVVSEANEIEKKCGAAAGWRVSPSCSGCSAIELLTPGMSYSVCKELNYQSRRVAHICPSVAATNTIVTDRNGLFDDPMMFVIHRRKENNNGLYRHRCTMDEGAYAESA
ncbi:hypothetical protein E2C01_056548 [Portunus trituberculatus]|uniref:Uncharacterized protein n=1 Tax=Portunus trituberculatus TaxID=210409 RepID=A0A5B7GXR4_PORTR|nr:hypothetical protein [Portunus trituberculatus]